MKQELKIEKIDGGMNFQCENMNAMDLICALKLCIESIRKTLDLPKPFYNELLQTIINIDVEPKPGNIDFEKIIKIFEGEKEKQ